MRFSLLAGAFVIGLVLVLASPVAAMESISLPGDAEATLVATAAPAAGTCPQLTRIKYPFLACSIGAAGGTVLSDFGEELERRHIPNFSDFVIGSGYWGPE